MRRIILLIISICISNIGHTQKFGKASIDLFNKSLSAKSKLVVNPSSTFEYSNIIASGFSNNLDFLNLGIRGSYAPPNGKFKIILELANNNYTVYYMRKPIQDTIMHTITSGSSGSGSATFDIGLGISKAVNCSKNNIISIGIMPTVIFTKNQNSTNSIIRYKDSYHNITYNRYGRVSTKVVYAAQTEIMYQHFRNKLSFGVGIFCQVGLKGYAGYNLDVKNDNEFWQGQVRTNFTAVGFKLIANVINFNLKTK